MTGASLDHLVGSESQRGKPLPHAPLLNIDGCCWHFDQYVPDLIEIMALKMQQGPCQILEQGHNIMLHH